MAAARVVPGLDPLEDGRGEFPPGGPGLPVEQLALQGPEERLHHRVVERGTDPLHRAEQARCAQPMAESLRGVLRAPVGVHHGLAGRRPAAPAGHLQGVDHQFAPEEVVGDRPTYDPTRVHVQHRGAVELAFAGGLLGDVGAELVLEVVTEVLAPMVVAQGEPRGDVLPVALEVLPQSLA